MSLCLRGITWNHSRAFPPLTAAAQRYEELHPQVRIVWEKRSLDEFGHASLTELARTYDLLVIDHPMLGEVHRNGTLLDLLPKLDLKRRTELEADALGSCLDSYRYEGAVYALPIDAAAPTASYRPDLLNRYTDRLPQTWIELIDLARQKAAIMPGFPADLFLNFLGMCASRGGLVLSSECFLDSSVVEVCLEELKELIACMPAAVYEMNPIDVYEAMSSSDDFAYCPFAYTYSNYSRPGFAAKPLLFSTPVALREGIPLRTILGGTGIAVSTLCSHPKPAVEFCCFVAAPDIQTHLYGVCGGQPASRKAWNDSVLNGLSASFFLRTKSSIETAVVRPRYAGYVGLQQSAGSIITEFAQSKISLAQTLVRLERLYRGSLGESAMRGGPLS